MNLLSKIFARAACFVLVGVGLLTLASRPVSAEEAKCVSKPFEFKNSCNTRQMESSSSTIKMVPSPVFEFDFPILIFLSSAIGFAPFVSRFKISF